MLNVATGTKWVLGNWKMNGRLASNQALLAALLTDAQVNVAHVGLAVPTVYMAQVAQARPSRIRCTPNGRKPTRPRAAWA